MKIQTVDTSGLIVEGDTTVCGEHISLVNIPLFLTPLVYISLALISISTK